MFLHLNIIYHDESLLAVNKPHKLLSVPGLSEPQNLFVQVKAVFPNARVVHRLDMATSGLILFALNYPAQKAISQQFERKTLHKTYCALVHGRIHSRFGEIEAPLGPDYSRKTRHHVSWPNGKAASTRYVCLHSSERASRIRLYPLTGRSHQLRVHCQFIGHPIIGDVFYGLGPQEQYENPNSGANRLMLHAESITLAHPESGEPLTLICPTPF